MTKTFVFLSGKINLGDVLYVKRNGHLYAEGTLRGENVEIPVSLKSRHYAEVEERGTEDVLVEGTLFSRQSEDDFSLTLGVQEVYPYGGKPVNRVILHGFVASMREVRSAYILEVLSEAYGVNVYLSVFCDARKMKEAVSEKDEVMVIGRLRSVKETEELVVFADEVYPTLRNYEFFLSSSEEGEDRVWTDEE